MVYRLKSLGRLWRHGSSGIAPSRFGNGRLGNGQAEIGQIDRHAETSAIAGETVEHNGNDRRDLELGGRSRIAGRLEENRQTPAGGDFLRGAPGVRHENALPMLLALAFDRAYD